MPFDSAFVTSSASEAVFFALWVAVGIGGLAIGAASVIRANRVFRRRQQELDLVDAVPASERSDRGLASAA